MVKETEMGKFRIEVGRLPWRHICKAACEFVKFSYLQHVNSVMKVR